MNMTDKFQQYLEDRALSRVEIGEGRSLSLGFGEKNKRTFFMSHLREYREIELGTYGPNWLIKTSSLPIPGDNLLVSEDNFCALVGETASIHLLDNSIKIIFPSGEIEFLHKNDGDEDFHLFTPSRDCWEWKNRMWTMH